MNYNPIKTVKHYIINKLQNEWLENAITSDGWPIVQTMLKHMGDIDRTKNNIFECELKSYGDDRHGVVFGTNAVKVYDNVLKRVKHRCFGNDHPDCYLITGALAHMIHRVRHSFENDSVIKIDVDPWYHIGFVLLNLFGSDETYLIYNGTKYKREELECEQWTSKSSGGYLYKNKKNEIVFKHRAWIS